MVLYMSSCVLFRRFLNFFFSHIILIESYVNKLKQSVDEALQKRSKLVIHEVSFTKHLPHNSVAVETSHAIIKILSTRHFVTSARHREFIGSHKTSALKAQNAEKTGI